MAMHSHIVLVIGIFIISRLGCEAAVQNEARTQGICELCDEKLTRQQKELTRQQKELDLQQKENDLQQKEIDALKSELDAMKRSNGDRPSGGVSYIRWGRNTCPGSALIVYKGYMGGNHYTHGGSANYVCLPDIPQWGNVKDGFQMQNRMYGTEYETHDSETIFSKVNNGGRSLNNNGAVCVVCLVPTRSIQIMIPAKRTCPSGWTLEYRGYLASQHYAQSRTVFICLDEEPESLPGSFANTDGALLYAVEGECGSLPCPPYVNGWELACVVCTK